MDRQTVEEGLTSFLKKKTGHAPVFSSLNRLSGGAGRDRNAGHGTVPDREWGRAARAYARYSTLYSRRTDTESASSLPPRTLLGTASRVRPDFSRHTLVSHVCPSTVARTGVRPHPRVTVGACSSGTGAKTHPPPPGTRNSVELKVQT